MSASELLKCVHGNDRRALEAVIAVYGDDTSAVLNGLHSTAARVAIATGVSPKDFAAGVKLHWDYIANELNRWKPGRHR